MPELPEVETVRRDLEHTFAGKRVKRVAVTRLRSVRRHADALEFVARLEGRRFDRVLRRGKYLLIGLDDGNVLVAHLGMSGQLLASDATDPLQKHAHVVMTFDDGLQLRFVDPRTFGQLFVTSGQVAELAHFGPDPLEQVESPAALAALLHGRRTGLKALLMDQRFVAGIGNIYSDEVLFSAGIRYDRNPETLSGAEIDRLYGAIVATLRDAIEHRGSSLADEQYRDLFGRVGHFQTRHQVYDREGRACVRCGGAIARLKANGRSTYFCGQCQV